MKMSFFNVGGRPVFKARPTPNPNRWMNEAYSESALSAISKGFDFTPTETEIVRFVADALPINEIASAMDLPVDNVKSHMQSICEKTHMRNADRAQDLVTRILS